MIPGDHTYLHGGRSQYSFAYQSSTTGFSSIPLVGDTLTFDDSTGALMVVSTPYRFLSVGADFRHFSSGTFTTWDLDLIVNGTEVAQALIDNPLAATQQNITITDWDTSIIVSPGDVWELDFTKTAGSSDVDFPAVRIVLGVEFL